jgi:hypothetical protein
MYDTYNISLDEWISLLSISTRFNFDKVRQRAIREIDSSERYRGQLSPVDKIVLAKKFGVPSWLDPCYEALRDRPSGLNDEEAENLGAKTTNHIWKMRELAYRGVARPKR